MLFIYCYRISEGSDLDWFEIDSASGVIITKQRLDYDILTEAMLQLTIVSQDESANPLLSNTSVTITIVAANDHVPTFEHTNYEAIVFCNPLPADVITVQATDFDIDEGGNVQYSILSVRPYSKSDLRNLPQFSIDQNGAVRFQFLPFDISNTMTYEVVVMAKDDGLPCLSSTTTIQITVSCDQIPALNFYPEQYFVRISPGFYSDFTITTISASLSGQTSGSISYSIVTGESSFSIDTLSGRLFVANRNFQVPGLFVIQVRAILDSSNSESFATVYVFVDEVAVIGFQQSIYYYQILENIEPQSALSAVTASTTPTGSINSKITYKINSGDPNGYFQINNSSGAIFLSSTAKIDFEESELYNLTLVALLLDSEDSLLGFAECAVLIDVIDVNDNAPIFMQGHKLNETDSSIYFEDQIVFRLSGDQAYVGSMIYNATAFDCDSGINGELNYHLEEPLNALIVDENGLIFVKRPFPTFPYDYVDSVTVTSCDNGSPQLCNSFRLHVAIQAWLGAVITTSNTINNIQAHIFESTPQGSVIVNLSGYLSSRFNKPTTVDHEGSILTLVSYEIDGYEFINMFGIFPDGQMYLKSTEIDREHTSFFCPLITVSVFDGERSFSLNSTVNIAVGDVNDNSPQFSEEEIFFSVYENEPAHTIVGYLRAYDADDGIHSSVVYLISEGQNNLGFDRPLPFSVNKYTGAIATACELDLETLTEVWSDFILNFDTFVFRVTAKDNAGIESSSTFSNDIIVKIQVQDRNEFPPEFSRSFYVSNVTEDANPAVSVLHLLAEDNDYNSTLYYRISSTDSDLPFTVDRRTGRITVNKSLNRETQSLYFFSVIAADGISSNSFTATSMVQINILDVNNNAPQFDTSTLVWNISESARLHQKVGQIIAIDPDSRDPNSIVSFKLSAINTLATRQTFRVDESSGYFILIDTLDRERQSSYDIIVEASDSGTSQQLTTTTAVRVNVDDDNDSPPSLDSPKSFNVEEGDYPNPISVGTLLASDEDDGDNGRVSFKIVQIMPYMPDIQITLLENSGQLFLAGDLDREKLNPLSKLLVVVEISDNPNNEEDKLVTQDFIEILVGDVNDNDPKLISPNAMFIPTSSAQQLGEVATLSVEDPDSGVNGSVIFTQSVSNPNQWFRVQSKTGILELYNALPFDHSNVFTLAFGVQDGGKSMRL